MEGLRRFEWPVAAVVLTAALLLVMVPQVSSIRYIVGGNMGWSQSVNYTIWAQGKHFYNGDWLCKYISVPILDLLIFAEFVLKDLYFSALLYLCFCRELEN